MPISNDRRIYVTFDNADEVADIKAQASNKGLSASGFIIWRLRLLDLVENDLMGALLIERLLNGAKDA